jgi:hypothetical protein
MPVGDIPADSLPRSRTDRVFAVAGNWAVASDRLQWMLMRHVRRKRGDCWDAVSFVSSTRDILARCMQEKGVEPGIAAQLLSGLPDTFDQWKTSQTTPQPSQDVFERADMGLFVGPTGGSGPVARPEGPIGLFGLTGPAGSFGLTGPAG